MIANHRITLISLQHPTQYKSSIKVPSKSPSLSPGRIIVQFSGSVVPDSATPCTAAQQAAQSFSNSWSLLKLTSIESGGAIQPYLPLASPSPPAFNLSQHPGLFQGVSSLHQVAKLLELQLQH